MSKERLDVLLIRSGLAESREQAKRLIMAGEVSVNGEVETKPGRRFPADSSLSIRRKPRYVSRGGLKLEGAISDFGIDVTGAVALDVGASTGGFTDCLLQHGAKLVYAVDVGYGQLDYRLRRDDRVKPIERVNARYLTPEMFDQPPNIATIDVAFISLKLILPAVAKVIKNGAAVIALVKPQFEAGREKVEKGGVVRSPETHREVLESVRDISEELGLNVSALTFSPIMGPAGNIEFFLLARKGVPPTSAVDRSEIDRVVLMAHKRFATK